MDTASSNPQPAGADPTNHSANETLPEVRVLDDAPDNGAPVDAVVWSADLLAQAPAPQEGDKPSVRRVHTGDRANHIVFTFAAGQQLRRHRCAHPITVSCPEGAVDFAIDGHETVRLTGAAVVHLPAQLPHSVRASEAGAVLWLIMHTGD